MHFIIAFIARRFFYAHVYRVTFLFLWGIEFIQFVGLSIVGALDWYEGGGVGLTLGFSNLRNVYW